MSKCSPGLIASLLLLFLSHGVVLADEIEEIIVYADFRERLVDEVPASITVLDAERISELAVQHFEELVNAIPNLNWSGDGHRARYFQIRGIDDAVAPRGRTDVDHGIVLTPGFNQAQQVLDVHCLIPIEIDHRKDLRLPQVTGPQSAWLHGAKIQGGTIRRYIWTEGPALRGVNLRG